MPGKPIYEELEQRNKDLEKKAAKCKLTEEALRESEKRFKNITNSIEELLVLLDQNFKVQMINSKLAKAYNVSLDEYKGKHCYELFYGSKHICEGCPAIKVLNEEKVIRGALRYRPDGRIFYRTFYPFIEDHLVALGKGNLKTPRPLIYSKFMHMTDRLHRKMCMSAQFSVHFY